MAVHENRLHLLLPLVLLIAFQGLFFPSLGFSQDKSFNPVGAPPLIHVSPETIDFGELLVGEKATRTIRILNQGRGDLELLKITHTCGCTVAQLVLPSGEAVIPDKKGERKIGVLHSGEAAELGIELSTVGYQGKLERKVSIFTNDPLKRTFPVALSALIEPAFTIEPYQFDFRKILKNTTAERSVVIRSTKAGPFKITGFKNLPPYFDYQVEELEDSDLPSARLTLKLKEEAPLGTKHFKLDVLIESEKVLEAGVHLSIDILPPVRFLTGSTSSGAKSILDFGVLKKGEGVVKEIEVINEIPGIPYPISKITLISKQSEFLETKLITVQEGVQYKIQVEVKSGIDTRYFRGSIQIHSSHPDLPRKEIAFKGWISKN